MSFWKTFGFHTVSAIDTLLEGGEFTLEQLLDEEEILQETKSQNKRLLDFLVKPETLKKLLWYITVEAQDEDDTKRKFKYPFLACEILASEVWAICDAMYQNPNLLDDLYSYFEKDPPLNPLLSSYTSRVAAILLSKKVAETIEYMRQRKDLIPNFLKHLGNASVMDLLLKVIACEDTTDGAGTLEWLCSTGLIPLLVEKFDPANPTEVHENASQTLTDIIIVSMNSSNSPLIAQLESEEIVNKLFGYILQKGLGSSLLHGLAVIIELLRRHVGDRLDDTSSMDDLVPLIKISVANAKTLTGLLDGTPSTNNNNSNNTAFILETQVGKFAPLGFERLKIVEFFAALFMTTYKCVDTELINLAVLDSALKLFFAYPWNNFLHGTVEGIIQGILEGEHEELKIHLLTDAHLLQRIVEASKENEDVCAKPKGIRRGYMGHITSISQSIINVAANTPSIDKILSEHQAWNDYVKNSLTSTKERESRTLGGYSPSDFPLEEQHDEFEEEYDEENGEIIFESANYESRDDFTGHENDFHLDAQEEEDEEPPVVIQSHIQEEEEEEELHEQVWEEKQIQDNSQEAAHSN